jgi:hypothetical protein
MKYHLESYLPLEAFKPRGGVLGGGGMTLHGGGGGIISSVTDGISNALGTAGGQSGILGGLADFDDAVASSVDGGWGGLAETAAVMTASYFGGPLGAAAARAAFDYTHGGEDRENLLSNAAEQLAVSTAGSYGGPLAAGATKAGLQYTKGGKERENALQAGLIAGGTQLALQGAKDYFSDGVEANVTDNSDYGYSPDYNFDAPAGVDGYGAENDLPSSMPSAPDPFVPDSYAPDVNADINPDVNPVSPDVAGYENLINQLSNTPVDAAPRDFDYIPAAATTPNVDPSLMSDDQKKLFEQGMRDLQNRATVNVAGEPRFTEDPFKYLSNQGQDAATYLRDTPLSEMGEDAYNLVRRNPLETAGIALFASNLMGGQQQPQPQGSPSQDAYDGKYTGGYGSAGTASNPYLLRNRVNAQNVYGYSSPISRYADGGEVKHFGVGGLSNAITRFTQPIEKAIIRPIGDAVPFLRDAAPYAGLLAAPFIASPAMAAGVGALSSGFGRPGSGFNMKRAMMGGIAAYGMSNLGAGIEAAGTTPAMADTGAGFTTGSMDAALNTPDTASSNFFRNPDAMSAGIKNLAGGNTYGQAATQFATKAGLPSAGMAVMGTSGVMAIDEGIEQQKAADAAAAATRGENQEMLNRIAAGKKRAQEAVKANPYMYAIGGSVDDEYGMDEARGLMTGNLQNGFMGGMPSYAAGGMPNLGLSRLSQPAFNEGAVGGIPQFAAGGTPRFLSGGGDGMSDSIPATIEGNQEARLADGEFVIPADVVSHLGNGSSKAGAKQLYSMMDRVRQARVGTKKQGREIKPKKFMPV